MTYVDWWTIVVCYSLVVDLIGSLGVAAHSEYVAWYLQSDVGLASLCTVIGQKKKRRQPIKQSDTKLKPVLTSSLSFSRALRSLLFAFLSSHWLLWNFLLCWLTLISVRTSAREQRIDVVLVDTAGRMQDNEPLMRALSKVRSVCPCFFSSLFAFLFNAQRINDSKCKKSEVILHKYVVQNDTLSKDKVGGPWVYLALHFVKRGAINFKNDDNFTFLRILWSWTDFFSLPFHIVFPCACAWP